MKHRFSTMVGVGVFSLLLGGCQPADTLGEGEVAEVQQPQVPINPDYDWRHYYFELENDVPFADLLVIGENDVGDFDADTEYWFIHTAGLADLGEEDLVVSYTDGDNTPPSLSGDQEFTQPVYLTWQSFSTDPVGTGELYSNSDHYLRIKADGGEVVRLTWYQVLPHQSPQNVAPNGVFSAVGGSVSVSSGRYGYYIDATIE